MVRPFRVEVVLEVGSVSEAVEVARRGNHASDLECLHRDANERGDGLAQRRLSTHPPPRRPVRDYFPETLLWLPEVLTDSTGQARIAVKLAGNVTTWKAALIASTLERPHRRSRHRPPRLPTLLPRLQSAARPHRRRPRRHARPPSATTRTAPQPVGRRTRRERLVHRRGRTARVASTSKPTAPPTSAFPVTARRSLDKAPQRLSANAGKAARRHREVTARPSGRPAGDPHLRRPRVRLGDLSHSTFPPDAITGGTRGELRLYPNFTSLLLESAGRDSPHARTDCAEQTVSTGYANLIAWRFCPGPPAYATRDVEKRCPSEITSGLAVGRTRWRSPVLMAGISLLAWRNTAHAGRHRLRPALSR